MSNVPPVAASPAAVRLERTCLASADESLLRDWAAFEANSAPDYPVQDPAWVKGYFLEDLENITTFLLRDGADSVRGSASFLAKDWPLKLYLGEIGIAELPLRRLRLLGGRPALPEDESLYDVLFRELIATPGYDAIYFSQVPVDSFLWKYLTTSPLLRGDFYRYRFLEPSPHPMLRFGPSFDAYMKGNFSSTHRYTLRRKISKFQERSGGKVRLMRCTRPEEVTPFLEGAVQVSRKTYQWNLHKRGLRGIERFERRYRFAAEHGWFRSYLLFVGDTPCAFQSGYQWRGRYSIDELGFDPAFTRDSPGTVMQLMAIQDMFEYERPEFIDFGSYDKYKEELSTESYTQCDLMLLRRGPYCRFVQMAHYGCRLATKSAGALLRRFDLKGRLKKKIRERSVSSKQASTGKG